MKNLISFITIALQTTIQLSAQHDVDGARPTGSNTSGANIGINYNTNIQLTTHTHSASHGILFNSYKPASLVSGSLIATGNTKHARAVGGYGGGAGAIMFFANGGSMDFLISDVSTGGDSNVSWGTPKLTLKRNGTIGMGTSSPQTNLHIDGGNVDDVIWPLWVDNTRNASAVTGYGVGIRLKHSISTETKWSGIASIQESSYANGCGLALYSNEQERVRIRNDGNVGIGIVSPEEKLEVAGVIKSTEVKVESQWWPDHVFSKSYSLKSLQDTEKYIEENMHLPGIPSAQEVKEGGVSLGEMNAKLLEKIEELTLHMIELKKENEALKQNQESINTEIEKIIEKLKN